MTKAEPNRLSAAPVASAPAANPVRLVAASPAPTPASAPARPALALAVAVAVAVAPEACRTAEAAAAQGLQAPAGGAGRRVVTGAGRLQFYAAPDLACRQNGVFILAGEAVEVLQQYGDFATVRYVNPRNGNQAQGWVQVNRLGGGGQVVSQAGEHR